MQILIIRLYCKYRQVMRCIGVTACIYINPSHFVIPTTHAIHARQEQDKYQSHSMYRRWHFYALFLFPSNLASGYVDCYQTIWLPLFIRLGIRHWSSPSPLMLAWRLGRDYNNFIASAVIQHWLFWLGPGVFLWIFKKRKNVGLLQSLAKCQWVRVLTPLHAYVTWGICKCMQQLYEYLLYVFCILKVRSANDTYD